MAAVQVPLPVARYIEGVPKLQRFISSSMSAGRLTNVVEYADPLWTADVVTAPMRYSDAARHPA